MTSDIDPKALALNLPELVYEALRFANFAAGEGLCAPEDQALARDPDLFLSDYTDKSGDDDWDTMPARIRDALAAFLREAVSPCVEAKDWRERDLDLIAQHEKAEAFKAGAEAMRTLCAKLAKDSYLPAHMSVNQTWGDASNTRALGIARAILALPLPPPPARIEDAEEPSHDRR